MTVEEQKDDGEGQQEINDEENQQETKNNEPDTGVAAKEEQEVSKNDDKTPVAKPKKTNSGRGDAVSTTPQYPKSFYDPITQKIMIDPVVAPSGESYEKNDAVQREPNTIYYANRALKAYIEHEVDRTENAGSVRGKLLEITDSIRTNFQKLLENSAIPSSEFKPLPEGFYCPISFDLIHDPVIDPDGHTYERAAIYHWIRANNDSPITRNPLSTDQLYDNTTLLNCLLELTENEDEQMIHPSIRRWQKDESERKKNPPPTIDAPSGEESNANNSQAARQSWPSNHQELNAANRRSHVRAFKCTAVAFFLAFIVAFLFVPSAIGYILFGFILFFFSFRSYVRGQNQDGA